MQSFNIHNENKILIHFEKCDVLKKNLSILIYKKVHFYDHRKYLII